jgi:hypothetical protein
MSRLPFLCTTCLVLLPSVATAQDSPALERFARPSPEIRALLGDVPSFRGALDEQVASLADAADRREGDPGTVHLAIDFSEPPDPTLVDALREAGVELLGRMDDDVWAAAAGPDGIARLSEEALVDAAVYPVAAKISPLFADAVREEDASLDDGAAISVTFFEGVPEEAARSGLEQIGASAEGEAAQDFALTRTLPARLPEGGLLPLALLDEVQMIEPAAPPDIPFNQATAQPLSNVDDVQGPPFELNGTGVTLGIWEAGAVVRATHEDLTPRVTVQAGQTATQSRHANHVAGTMVASGVNTPAAEGMAPAADLLSWDAPSDFTEMSAAAAPGAAPRITASNHSYGQRIGWDPRTNSWNPNQARFGSYTTADSAVLDRVIAGNAAGTIAPTELVSVWAAGNDRNDAPLPGIVGGPQDCFQGGLFAPGGGAFAADCIGPDAVAKNVITVGAMNGAGAIAGFSSYGPTDDGRIKPDLVAQGVSLLSLGDAPPAAQTDTGTSTTSGTSMAAPVVAGIVGLMREEFASTGLQPIAAAYKAILIQTARDVQGVGQSLPGPDFATGWGIADAEAALRLLRRAGGPGYAEGTVASTGAGNAWTFPFVVPAGAPELRVTLAWSDLPSAAGGGLVNDLDLRLLPPGGGAPEQPFAPNAAAPWQVAAAGDNTADNVEQVLVAAPAAGTWTAQVTAKPGSLVAGPQRFAIAGPITPDAGPIAGPKSDIVLVLDKSGSMGLPSATPGLSKMQSLQGAAEALVDYLELVGGHGLSVVAFDSVVRSTTPPVGLGPLDATSAGAARQAVGNLAPGGGTGIIAGVTEAAARLGSSMATNPGAALVLFSDGRHNSPAGSDVTAIDAVMDDDTRFFSIGFGTDVDSTVMPGVAANHDGVHLEEQGLLAGQLSKLFMVVGGLAADEQVVIDPDYDIAPSGLARQATYAAPEDRSLTFSVFWDQPGRPMDFLLVGPDGRCKLVDRPHEGYAVREGDRHRIVRVSLPYRCQGGPAEGAAMHEGIWQLQMRNRGDTEGRVKVMALADSTTRLAVSVDTSGRDALLTARLVTGGTLATKGVRIRAEIRPNHPSTGDSREQDLKGGSAPDQGRVPDVIAFPPRGGGFVTAGDEPSVTLSPEMSELRDRIVLQRDELRIDLPDDVIERLLRGLDRGRIGGGGTPRQMTVDLRDDGQGADRRAGDGIFTARVRADAPVLHSVRLVAEQARPGGVLTREALTSFLVR